MNTKNLQLPTQVLAVIEVFGRENIKKISKIQPIQPDEKPLSTTAELYAVKEIEQLDLFTEARNG